MLLLPLYLYELFSVVRHRYDFKYVRFEVTHTPSRPGSPAMPRKKPENPAGSIPGMGKYNPQNQTKYYFTCVAFVQSINPVFNALNDFGWSFSMHPKVPKQIIDALQDFRSLSNDFRCTFGVAWHPIFRCTGGVATKFSMHSGVCMGTTFSFRCTDGILEGQPNMFDAL